MPIYEYQCQACGQILDALQKINDAPLKKCPHCGKPKLKRLLSAPMFLLKGTGWYETDFKSDKERKRNLADRPEAQSEGDSKGEGVSKDAKADAKPEAKAESKPEAKESKAESTAASKPAAKPTATARKSRKAAKPAAKRARKR